MNKIKFALKHIAVLVIIISSFIACDKDFASVGSDIIGENNFQTESTKAYSVIAYTNPLEPFQTNNLTNNYLGAYKDPLYGLTTASFVSQLALATNSPKFGIDVKMDSVVLSVPYFSTRLETNTDGETIYKLDSIFGDGLIDLSIYENKYFLSSINPNEDLSSTLKYYSNSTTDNGIVNQGLLEGAPILLETETPDNPTNTITNFKPSNKEIKLLGEDNEIAQRLVPAMRIKLDTLYWREKIIDKQNDIVLSNSNNFINYFRGVYFKATPISGSGNLALLDFNASTSNITIYYSSKLTEDAERTQSSFLLRFNGNKVNFIDNQFNIPILQGDPVNGDEKLYLKGAGGSIAVIDLFKSGAYENGFSPEFLAFKNEFVFTDEDNKFLKSKRLVNEANLVFYVDQDVVIGNEPDRLYLYDLTNGSPLRDYGLDFPNSNPQASTINHLGPLKREGNVSTGEGIKYKMKITEYINNLLLLDSTNVKLGLAVSGNVNIEALNRNPLLAAPQFSLKTTDDDVVKTVPQSSILIPRGTVLYGNNTSNTDKKLYIEIFYTEPNN